VSSRDEVLAILGVIVLARIGLIARAWQQNRRGHGPAPQSCGRAARCRSGKVSFDTREDADRVVRRSQIQRRESYDRPLERSYRCPHCGRWHTTSQRRQASW
jgi:hypothetical protein